MKKFQPHLPVELPSLDAMGQVAVDALKTSPVDLSKISVVELGLGTNITSKLLKNGLETLADFQGIVFPEVYEFLSFEQAKMLLKVLLEKEIDVLFAKPDWDQKQWSDFVASLVDKGIVSWFEIAMAICGELNPPQVGTAVASNPSFQAKFPPRETMRNVMDWFYAQSGKCNVCGTRLFLEADHIRAKQDFLDNQEDVSNADTLENLQLLCKRCNVIKRPTHALGGISFAPAQSTLIWILLSKQPNTKQEFYFLCREHGLTMANIRFDEAWAFAEWLRKDNKYPPAK